MILRRFGPWLAVAALLCAAAALHARTALATAVSPDVAVRQAVEARGERYAGDCAATVAPRDIGMTCSRLIADEGGRRAYLTGRTFSEFSRWLFLADGAGSWRIAGEAPLDFSSPSLDVPWPR
jgi:hypothetical protein